MEGLKLWYPDVMANLMAVAWLPASPRNRALFDRLRKEFGHDIPKSVGSQVDLERLIWWGWAANGAGDRTLLARVCVLLSQFETVNAQGLDCGNLGHVARLTARS